MIYRVEILGKVPAGLTWNEVHATILQVLDEYSPRVQSVTKRRLTGNHVSVIAVYEAGSYSDALTMMRIAGRSVYNFSFDVIGPKSV